MNNLLCVWRVSSDASSFPASWIPICTLAMVLASYVYFYLYSHVFRLFFPLLFVHPRLQMKLKKRIQVFVTILYLTFLLIFVLFLLPIGFCRWPSSSDSGPLASLAICWNRPMSRLSGHYGTSHLPTRTNIKMASNTNTYTHSLKLKYKT